MVGGKDMQKWSRFPFLNHPIGTHGPRCRYLHSNKTGAYTRHHVTANHVAATQKPDEAARLSCKVRSPWLAGYKELCPSCRQTEQAGQMLGSEVMQEVVCRDDIYARLQPLEEFKHVRRNCLKIPMQCGKAVADRIANNILLID